MYHRNVNHARQTSKQKIPFSYSLVAANVRFRGVGLHMAWLLMGRRLAPHKQLYFDNGKSCYVRAVGGWNDSGVSEHQVTYKGSEIHLHVNPRRLWSRDSERTVIHVFSPNYGPCARYRWEIPEGTNGKYTLRCGRDAGVRSSQACSG